MPVADQRPKYMLPRAENVLEVVMNNIIGNLRRGQPAKVSMAPLIQRAYTVINETGVIPYKDYDASVVFIEEQ